MKRNLIAALALLPIAFLCACLTSRPVQDTVASDTVAAGQCIRTAKAFANDPANFQFAIMADRTGGMRPGIFEEAAEKVNLLQPEFVMCVGDLIEGGTQDRGAIDRQWAEFNAIVDNLQMPFFYLPGNHDITNQVMHEEWLRRFKLPYYHFTYKNVLFLCMNSQDPPSQNISQEQSQYMAGALAANPDVRWTFVLMHAPMWRTGKGWADVEKHLVGRPHTVFAGHHHTYAKEDRDGASYIVLATTGGASSLSGFDNGQFDHVVWVTMTDDGPVIANLLLDGIR